MLSFFQNLLAFGKSGALIFVSSLHLPQVPPTLHCPATEILEHSTPELPSQEIHIPSALTWS